jgi:hypothetical protein
MRLPFELDPQIIHHIIYSQAGSIAKAIIELVMNSVDAKAARLTLTITEDGFACVDNGGGFSSRDDVVRYFGKFGTPHAEGDATYGRFRLGRGQIMAHASTVWESHLWRMSVDTQQLGYNYELDEVETPKLGCAITGKWYESLSKPDLACTIQEVRDLVRYTPLTVVLNERQITRPPTAEEWSFEDEFAYYRVKPTGALSIYNLGVLVRQDAGHVFGAGGVIVTKQAIGLNVSRTEVLRKTCPVWKAIAKRFRALTDQLAGQLGDNRHTEERRKQMARALVALDENFERILREEPVVTVLPGKRHLTMQDFLVTCTRTAVTVLEQDKDVPKGESIARAGVAQVVHPSTLERFGCANAAELHETLELIMGEAKTVNRRYWEIRESELLPFAGFAEIKEHFAERMEVVEPAKVLDKETRRSWTALRNCLLHYAAETLKKRPWNSLQILLGRSNTAEAWTDGRTYIAIDIEEVKKLSGSPIQAVGHILSLVDHELAHEGDSVDCGHDEAFLHRYHELSLRNAGLRQLYLLRWVQKYTKSLAEEGKPGRGRAVAFERAIARAENERHKRRMPGLGGVDDVDDLVDAEPDPTLLGEINARINARGVNPAEPDWAAVIEEAQWAEALRAARWREQQAAAAAERAAWHLQEAAWLEEQRLQDEEMDRQQLAYLEEEERRRAKLAEVLGVDVAEISEMAMCFLKGEDVETLKRQWAEKLWEKSPAELRGTCGEQPGRDCVPAEVAHLVNTEELGWMLERASDRAAFSAWSTTFSGGKRWIRLRVTTRHRPLWLQTADHALAGDPTPPDDSPSSIAAGRPRLRRPSRAAARRSVA